MGLKNRITDIARTLAGGAVRPLAAFPLSRSALNLVYSNLTPRQQSVFHAGFAKIFRGNGIEMRDGSWEVAFLGKRILVPLARSTSWLDWDTALSIVGHDVAIKQTYRQLIESSEAPELFVDVGANYGTHSLLFLTQGIETLTFEPNPSCHAYLESLCRVNGVRPDLEKVALGAIDTDIELSYPERDTWLGSTDPGVVKTLRAGHKVTTAAVRQRTLDEYIDRMARKRVLIKIDTEGNELSVLEGAGKTLAEIRPRIIFECWASGDRKNLFDFFCRYEYGLARLPWAPRADSPILALDEFSASKSKNFIALPL